MGICNIHLTLPWLHKAKWLCSLLWHNQPSCDAIQWPHLPAMDSTWNGSGLVMHISQWTGSVNILGLRQNGHHFTDNIFKRIFLNENVKISIEISLTFVPKHAKGPINNIPALVLIMAWRQPGAKPLSEPLMVRSSTHICVTRLQWVNGLVLNLDQAITLIRTIRNKIQ